MKREYDYILACENNHPNPLPKDGLPRITKDGYRILKDGMAGNLDEWAGSIGNHPLALPPNMCRNLCIRYDPDNQHFNVEFWYGQDYPRVDDYLCLAPCYTFDSLTETEGEYIKLGQKLDKYAWDGVIILIEDFGTDRKHERTLYHTWRGRYGDNSELPEQKPEPVKKPLKTVSLFDFESVKI